MRPDAAKINEQAGGLFAAGLDATNYVTRAFAFLSVLLPTELSAYGILDIGRGELDACFNFYPTGLWASLEAYGLLMHKYEPFRFDPTVNGGRPFSARDFYTQAKFHDLDIYQEVHKPMGFEDHCFVHVPAEQGSTVFFGLFRGGAFGDDEKQVLTLAQSHLTAARRLAMAWTANAGLAATPGVFARAGYSPRECEVLHGLAQGQSDQEIADSLHLRVDTVRAVLGAIYEKMGVADRVAATLGALKLVRQVILPAPFRVATKGGEPE